MSHRKGTDTAEPDWDSLEVQLKAACTVHNYKASRLLGFYQSGSLNDVPDRHRFQAVFTFTPTELHWYIASKSLASEIIALSLGQRGSPSAYVEQSEDGYRVGWFDGQRRNEKIVPSELNAAN